jgi:hypothetical protein
VFRVLREITALLEQRPWAAMALSSPGPRPDGAGGYATGMGDSRLSPGEIRAAAEVHNELGPDYRDAVVESFLEKIDKEVLARIDAQLASTRQARTRTPDPAHLDRKRSQLGAMAAGSALTALASGAAVEWSLHYPGSSPIKALATVWAILAVLYLAYAWRLRRR